MLSGGEQQMLTICRSLLGNPRVILIDEPTEGLAPKIVEVVTEVIRDICRQGVAVLLVEQKLTIALRVVVARLRDGPRPHRLRGHPGIAPQCARGPAQLARGRLRRTTKSRALSGRRVARPFTAGRGTEPKDRERHSYGRRSTRYARLMRPRCEAPVWI